MTVFLTRLLVPLVVSITLITGITGVLILVGAFPPNELDAGWTGGVLDGLSAGVTTLSNGPTPVVVGGSAALLIVLVGWGIVWALHYPIGPLAALARLFGIVQFRRRFREWRHRSSYTELSPAQRHLLAEVNRTTVALRVAAATIDSIHDDLSVSNPKTGDHYQPDPKTPTAELLADLTAEWHAVERLARRLQVLRVDHLGRPPDEFLDRLATTAADRYEDLQAQQRGRNDRDLSFVHVPAATESVVDRAHSEGIVPLLAPADVRDVDPGPAYAPRAARERRQPERARSVSK